MKLIPGKLYRTIREWKYHLFPPKTKEGENTKVYQTIRNRFIDHDFDYWISENSCLLFLEELQLVGFDGKVGIVMVFFTPDSKRVFLWLNDREVCIKFIETIKGLEY